MDISHKIKFGIFFVCLLFVSLQLVCIFVLKYNGNDIHIWSDLSVTYLYQTQQKKLILSIFLIMIIISQVFPVSLWADG